jgi:hypothetical protein
MTDESVSVTRSSIRHGDAAERAQGREAVVAQERHDRIDLVRDALHVQADEHLPT